VFLCFFLFCLAWKFVSIWLVFPLTFLCGIIGGWGYLWSLYRLMDNTAILPHNKEIMINVMMICADMGALMATLFVLILDNTIMTV
jgi:hypothetical protein